MVHYIISWSTEELRHDREIGRMARLKLSTHCTVQPPAWRPPRMDMHARQKSWDRNHLGEDTTERNVHDSPAHSEKGG